MAELTLTDRPRLAGRVRVFRRGNLALLLAPATGVWTVVSDSARRLTALCDGRRTVDDLAHRWGLEHGLPPAQARADVRACLRQLDGCGLLTDRAPRPLGGATPPCRGEVAVHLTSRCNLRCRHCYAASHPSRGDFLPLEQVLALVDATRARARWYVFSGGEPLLYPRWREVLAHARSCAPTKLVTNGTLLTPDDCRWLAEHDISVQISLDGACPATHDWLRGPGAWERATAALRRFCRAGHGSQVGLGCTLTCRSAPEAAALLDRAAQWGVGNVHFMPVNRHGRAERHWPDLALSTPAYEALCRRLSARRRELRGILEVTGCLGDFVERTLLPDGRPRCPVEDNLMVECTGEMYPCILLTGPRFRLGRLGAEPPGLTYASPARDRAVGACRARLATSPACRECDWRMLCQGACPGLVWWQTGTLEATDGLCDLRRELYVETIFAWVGERLDQPLRAN